MRKLTGLALASAMFFGVIGCDGGGDLKEGTPANVDMTKNFSPDIPVGPISAKDLGKAKAKEAAAVKDNAPVK